MELSEKKIEILKAAEEVFAIRGIDAASVRDISKVAKINIAMISYYFGSKEKLAEALFEWRVNLFKKQMNEIVDSEELQPFEKLNLFLKNYLKRILESPEFHRIMVREHSKKTISPTIEAKINEIKMLNIHFIQRVIEEGYQQQVFKRKAPAEAIIMTVIGGTSYLILNEKTYSKLWNISSHEDYSNHINQEYYPYLLDALKAILQYDEK